MKYFKLFACCKMVKGACRSLILDFQRGKYETIPNDLYEFIENNEGVSLDELKYIYGNENERVIDEYFNFLIEAEYGFWCYSKDEYSRFPDISNEWEVPHRLSNAIIDIGNDPEIDYMDIIQQIIYLRIPHIQIRSLFLIDFELIQKIVIACEGSNVTTIQLFFHYQGINVSISRLKAFVRRNIRIKLLMLYNAPYSHTYRIIDKLSYIRLTRKCYTTFSDCGLVNRNFFCVNLNHYMESRKHNSCLNRKISIDANGIIRNCPNMEISFGNIRDKKLIDAMNAKGFQDMWCITKDKIDVCKDCEFRYLCTDCRANIRDTSNIFSQPARCNYNPYLAKWKGEKGFVSIEKWLKCK